jgi:hypothetical protein
MIFDLRKNHGDTDYTENHRVFVTVIKLSVSLRVIRVSVVFFTRYAS